MANNYFSVEKYLLRLIGVSLLENDSNAYKIYSLFVLTCFIIMFPFIQSGDVFKHDFIDRARVFLYLNGETMGLIMALSLLKNRRKLGKLFESLEEIPFLPNTDRGGDEEKHLIDEWAININKQRCLLYCLAAMSMSFACGWSLLQRVMYSDPMKWTFSFGPLTVLNVTYSPNYEISWIYQNISLVYLAIPMCITPIILSGILSFTSVQFQILQHNLRNIVEISYQKALQEYNTHNGKLNDASPPWKYLRSEIKEAISYHLKILELISELEEIFSASMLALYLSVLCILGCMMYVSFLVHDVHSMILMGEGASVCLFVLLVCYWGERVADESVKVGLAAYESNFVGTDLRFQRALVIIMRKCLYPTRIKAAYMIETSLVTLVWIYRTSYSCFMVLKSTK